MHIPREPLQDMGFMLFPALSKEQQIWSEVVFFTLFGLTIGFAMIYPFWNPDHHLPVQRRRFATLMTLRFLGVCAAAQALRIISFLVTTLPGPNYHCRPNSKEYNPPKGIWDILLTQDPFTHCGDLVFSSHTIFIMLCALTWHKYSRLPAHMRVAKWLFVLIFGSLVVAARKHYSLDVVVAMYTVPLLWIAIESKFPDSILIPSELNIMATQLGCSAAELEPLAAEGMAELPLQARGSEEGNDRDIV